MYSVLAIFDAEKKFFNSCRSFCKQPFKVIGSFFMGKIVLFVTAYNQRKPAFCRFSLFLNCALFIL